MLKSQKSSVKHSKILSRRMALAYSKENHGHTNHGSRRLKQQRPPPASSHQSQSEKPMGKRRDKTGGK
jgi:hypothetical protein